jgi:hypothetical protein
MEENRQGKEKAKDREKERGERQIGERDGETGDRGDTTKA